MADRRVSDSPIGVATLPVVRARLDEAVEKKYVGGVIGVHARPIWEGAATFDHRQAPVRVATCVSTLAVREALLDRPDPGWLVIITDRGPEDLGDGILAHIIGSRLRAPDEWEALRQRFQATGIDAALQRDPHSREVASALLAVEPRTAWPPAPSGVLTLDHAMTAVFRHRLGLTEAGEIDGTAILRWSSHPDTPRLMADLRALGGDRLVDAALSWAADQLGLAREPVFALLRSGQAADVVPVGIIAGLLISDELTVDESVIARDAVIRLEPKLGGTPFLTTALRALTHEVDLLTPDRQVRTRGDDLLVALKASALAVRSDLLPGGLHARLSALAERLRTAMGAAQHRRDSDRDAAVVPAADIAATELAWAAVQRHIDARSDARVRPFAAAVRLARWLAQPPGTAITTLTELVARYRDHDAWVDVAVNDAAAGAGDAEQAAALHAVLAVVRRRRDAHDAAFARALAVQTREDSPEPGVRFIEDVMAADVGPVIAKVPVLLLVLDGMSVATAIEVVADATDRGWLECSTGEGRSTAIAALPTITEVSRTSLFCGTLTARTQVQEQAGVAEFGRARGIGAKLFHKKLLDSSRPGFDVSDDVGAAIDDITGTRLVACVLNTVDDALDRSDPGGTDWTVEAIKHLSPLLERARTAGRVIVLTSDHGHIVERREGMQRSYPEVSSNRSRPADPGPGADEVLVDGRRVVKHGGRAVLAVNERLRYGPLKAGYHGGASPAEVIVPVLYLVSGVTVDESAGVLHRAPDPAPLWWSTPPPATVTPPIAAPHQ